MAQWTVPSAVPVQPGRKGGLRGDSARRMDNHCEMEQKSIYCPVKGRCSPRRAWDAYRGFGFASWACLETCGDCGGVQNDDQGTEAGHEMPHI